MVGAGGLGSSAGLYLGSAGVGKLTVGGRTMVDATNLQRQVAHTLERISQPKALSLQTAIAAINPDVNVVPVTQRADAALLATLVAPGRWVLDCTDNFTTRHAINRACFALGKPLVSGAAIRLDGQLSVRPARCRLALLCLRVPGKLGRGRNPLRHDGRVRAAGGHHRHHAGRRSAKAGQWHGARTWPGGC